MRKNAVIFRFFTWVVLAAIILVNVTPAASAPLAQNDVQASPTPAASATAAQNDVQASPTPAASPTAAQDDVQITPTPTASVPTTVDAIQSTSSPTPAPLTPKSEPSQNLSKGLTIAGRVTGAGQKPLAGVTVNADAQQQHSTVSGADGTFLITGLAPGRYLVTSSLEGMVMVPYYRVIVLVDKNASGVDFHQRLGGPVSRQVPSSPAVNQAVPSPVIAKVPGKSWTPPAVDLPQPLGGEMQAQAAFSLGQPGMAFRQADTYGTTEAGYIDHPAYLNSPAGIFVDGSGNLLIAESRGKRLLEYNASSTRFAANGVKGEPGVAYYSHNTFVNPQDVAEDDSGDIWMVDANRLVEFDSARNYIRQFPDTDPILAGTANNQFNNPSGIAFGDGLMYVADQGNQRIQVYVFVGDKPTYFRTIGETGVAGNDAAHFNGPAKVTFANGAIFVADMNNNRLMKCTLSGGTDFVCSEFILDGLVTNTQYGLNLPTAIAFASSSLYVTDAGNYRLIKCDWDGTLASNCNAFTATAGNPGTADDQFLWISDIAVAPGGNVYVSDSDNYRVQVYDATGALDTTHTIGAKDASGNPVPYPTDDTHFNGPAGMVYDPGGPYLYFAENLGQRLVKLKLNGDGIAPTVVWTAGQAGVYGSDDAHLGAFWGGSQGNLDRDSVGRIYVPDTANQRVLIYQPDGALWAMMGETGVTGTDNTHFNQPSGVSLDNHDNLYVADSGNDRIQVFDSNRNYVATLGESGVTGYDAGHFNWPMSVSVDYDGNIFVADTNNQRVQKCTLSGSRGNCLPFAGKTGVSSTGFDYLTAPTAVLYSSSEVYILDTGRSRVQVFDTTGAYRTTLVGDWGNRSGDMRGGLGLAIGASGDIYISDPVNQRIQKYESSLPATSDTPGWRQVNLNGFGRQYAPNVQAVTSFTVGATAYLFAAVDNSLTHVAELYKMDSNGNWSQVMKDGFGDPQNQAVVDLFVSSNVLYATTLNTTSGGQLYSSTDGITWTQVVLPGLDAWDAQLDVMQDFNGELYIGSAVASKNNVAPPHGARIVACNMGVSPADCAQVFEYPSAASSVLSMTVMGNWLYAGMSSPAGGQIYRCSTAACAGQSDWQQVFKNGNDVTGADIPDNSGVSSLAAYDVAGTTELFAGVANAVQGARVYAGACDDSVCSLAQVNSDGFDASAEQNSDVNALIKYGDAGKLLAITHNETSGLQIWGYDGTNWSAFLPYQGFGNSTNQTIYSPAGVTVFNQRLVVGVENQHNGGGVWASDPSAYSIKGVITGLDQIVYVGLSKNGVVLQNKPAQHDDVDNSYKFTFTGMLPGVYVVTPFSSSFSFVPSSRTVTVTNADVVTGVNFSASFHPLPLVSPVNGARLDGQTTTLNWADIQVAQYEYQISYNPDTFLPLYKSGKVRTTSVALTGLPFNKPFYWRVRDASSAIAPGAWSTVWTFTTPNPPGVPVLVSPISKSFLQNLSPAFSWTASTNSPDHYRLQVSQSTAFTTMDLDENTLGAVTTYQLESLLTPNRTYYWRVQAVSANGDASAWATAWTLKTYPETPWLVLPADSVVANSLRPTFQWNDSTNTGAYQIQITTFGITIKTVDVTSKYYTLDTALVPYMQYWWRVRAKGVGGYGAWSNVRVIYAPNPPGSTSMVAPAINAVVPGYQPVFSWTAVNGALHYNLQIATDAAFPFGKLRTDRFVDATTYDMSAINGDNLNSNGAYYWRVAACNAQYQCGNFTASRKFFTKPGTPAAKSPDEAAPVNSLGVTFTWDDQPSPLSPINSASFTLEIDKNAGCTGVSKTFAVKVLTFTTPLTKGLFYWHVKAAGVGGAAGASAWSDCRSINIEVPPSAPALASPAVNASVPDYRNIEFKWTALPVAPDGYEVQVSRDATFASVDLDNNTIAGTETSWKEVDLTDPYLWGGGAYYWRMRSKNTDGLWGAWSAKRTFTTLSTVYGYVTDVKTLQGVDGVTVEALQGANNTVVGTDTTAEQGYFIIHNVPKGTTTVRISLTGYITTSQKVNITAPSQNLFNFGFVSKPAANQYSFVLTWPTNSPRSFDMHLWTPNDPNKAHIFPYNEGSLTSSPYVHMDAANNPYFTEVITVDRQNLLAGKYVLAIAQVSPTTSSPTGSGATLDIYDESGNLVSGVGPYVIPKTGFGAWWYILDFTKTDGTPLDLTTGAPTVYNKIQNTSPAPWTDDKVMFGYVWLKDSSRGFANINVALTGKNGVVPDTSAKTDISGLFIVGGLAPGTYTVSPSAPGYDVSPASIDVVVYSTYPDPTFPYFYSDTFILTPVAGAKTGGDHRAIATQGHFTYLASGSSLDIYNIADKNNPVSPLPSHLPARFQPSIGKINDMVLAGNYAFLASDDGLNIVNISDPAAAYNAGYYLDYGGLTGVAVKGRYAYLLYGWADLIIVDINDFIIGADNPTVKYVSEFHIAGYGERITISGNYAYIAYGDTGEFRGMYVVNIADPLHPQGIGFAAVSGYPIDVQVSGNYAYLVGGVNYDYITGAYTGGRLNVFDISNPSMPRQITEMNFTDPVYDVKASAGFVYLANGAGGMKILDARDPKFGVVLPIVDPGFISAYPATCIDVLDRYGYVGSKDPTTDDSKMEVVSLANKAAPLLSGSIVPAP